MTVKRLMQSSGLRVRVPSIATCKVIQDSLGFWIQRFGLRIPATGFWIPCQWNLDSGLQSLPGFRIPCAELRILESRIPFSTSKNFLNWDSRIRIYLTWDDKQMAEYFISQCFKRRTIKQVASCGQFQTRITRREELTSKKCNSGNRLPSLVSHGIEWPN